MDKYSKMYNVHIMFTEKFRKNEKPNYFFLLCVDFFRYCVHLLVVQYRI